MGINPKALDRFLNHTYCHQCGAILKDAETALLSESPTVSVVYIGCSECGGETLVTLSAGGYNMIDVKTDLLPSEVKRFFDAPPVSVDDVLDLHEFIQKGNIWQILEQEGEQSWEKKSKHFVEKDSFPLPSLKKEETPSPLS